MCINITKIGNDLNFPEIGGQSTPMLRIIQLMCEEKQHAAHHDAHLAVAFLKVINMIAPHQVFSILVSFGV